MKYIRTKDGRIELVAGSVKDQTNTLFYDDNKGNYISEKDILKQSDTIEELCDELVVVEPNNEDCPRPYILDCFYLCGYNSWFEREKEHIKTGTIVVYGEIWVDGELHKVAKMNDKGELELL